MRRPRLAFSDLRQLNFARFSAIALLVLGVVLGARTEIGYRHQAERQATVQADILAASVSAALAFDDAGAMRQYVDALQANPDVAVAAVYDLKGRPLMVFRRGEAPYAPAHAPAYGAHTHARSVTIARPVTEQEAPLGSVYLSTVPEPLTRTLGRHSGLALLTVMAVLLLVMATRATTQLRRRAAELAVANERLTVEMEERARAEEALRQSQKMEALGQLTGGIAHDFNNLLQVVHGAFELIRRKPQDAKVLHWVENGLHAADRGASLTRQLLAFSRSQRLELKPFAVAELIASMRELLTRTLGTETELVFDLDQARATVLSDRTQLELAILNLAINARDAMARGGRLTITTLARQIDDDPELEPGPYVELQVADTGPGMSAEIAERAFDPFFTTKGVGKGTGLGLSQVYGVARQAGGLARLETSPGRGTVVALFLRRSDVPIQAEGKDEAAAAAGGAVLAPRPDVSVMIVDDEVQVRNLTCDALSLLGYRALPVESGAAALDALTQETPDVVVMDYAMPGMSGAEAAAHARRLRPDLPIIFASGYADTAAVEASVGPKAVILRKPFNMEELAQAVATAVAEPSER